MCLIAPFFFFNDTATTEIYTLSLHDALPISGSAQPMKPTWHAGCKRRTDAGAGVPRRLHRRSEEHTSELQSLTNLVCRLLLEKKKKHLKYDIYPVDSRHVYSEYRIATLQLTY